MRLPRLPVSRRRHGYAPSGETSREDIPPPPETARALPETERLLAEAREAFYAVRRERDRYGARVAELEAAIREHRALHLQQDVGHDKNLAAVLIGHDRQEREHEPLEPPVVSDELRQMYEERKRARGGRR